MDLARGMLRDQHIWEDKRQGRKLYKHLRRKKKYRKRSQKGDNRGRIPNQKSIDERPEIVDARVRVGDWEADTITFDNGKEFAGHEKISQVLGVDIFFAHTYASWERGTNENTNGLIRQYIPKDADFRILINVDICFIEKRLNLSPDKGLGFSQPMVILKIPVALNA